VSGNLLIVLLERDPGGVFQGRFFLRDEHGMTSGDRRLRLRPCTAVVEALAVAVSVLLTPPPAVLRADEPAPAAAPAAEAAAPAAPEVQPPPEPPEPPAPARAAAAIELRQQAGRRTPVDDPTAAGRWQLGLGPQMSFDLTGDYDDVPGARLALSRLGPRLALVLDLQGTLQQTRRYGRGTVQAYTLAAGLAPCARWRRTLLCAAVSGGLVHARARGYDDNRALFRPTVGTGLRAGVELGEQRFLLRPYVWLETSLLRWRFTVDEGMALKQPRLSMGLGLEIATSFL
jgi:hypothetical protein